MAPLPDLRVVPLLRVRRHEEVDPLRVERLMRRINQEGIQVNPMVCAEGPADDLVLLDGATRTEAMRRLGLQHAVVQIVDPARVTLETWHHVVRQANASELVERLRGRPELVLAVDEGPPRVRLADGSSHSVLGNAISPYATLSGLVDAYVGRWTVSRVTDPHEESVASRFPDWTAVIEFPPLTVDDVFKAALGSDLLPAGVTRFLVPDRALRLNMDLGVLQSPGPTEDKQEALDRLLQERTRAGRVRRYEEAVFVLDD